MLKGFWLVVAGLFFLTSCNKPEKSFESQVISLTSNWKIQTSEKLAGTEDQAISQNGFDVSGWNDGIVPGTVMGALSTFKVIEDPTFGINMKNMDSIQFQKPWWYRTTFNITPR